MNIFCARSRFRPGCASRWPRNSAPATTARAGAGAPAASCCNSCPTSPERARQADLHPGDAPAGTAPHVLPEDDAWVEGRSLIATVDDIELIDPDLSSERLAYRLFHERGVRVFRAAPVNAQCSCSRDSVENMLQELSAERPRRHGRGRPDHRDLRILQLDLCVRAGRGGGAKLCVRAASLERQSLMAPKARARNFLIDMFFRPCFARRSGLRVAGNRHPLFGDHALAVLQL